MNATRCLFAACFASLALANGAVHAGDKPDRPNIVVILSDDQGWGDLSASGNKNLSTPNLDALARSGASFERFYVQPVCSPTRAEFLTGRYHPRTGVRSVTTGLERMNLGEITIAQLLRALGYRTGAFGKWHNGSQWPYHPNARGFEEYYGFTSGHWGEYFDPPLERNGKPVRGNGYIADDFTDKAVDFIAQHRAEPFFCYVAYNTPHSPFCVPDEDWNRFKDRPIGQRADDVKKEDLNVTRCALAMCENLDRNVGRILAKLDELKLAENTIVIFFCDNGPNSFRWNGGMRGRKGSTDEGGVRSPCFVRWPVKIAAGTVIPQIAGAIDLLPTLAAATKAPLPKGKSLDGRNLLPLLLRERVDWPDRRIFATFGGKISVRTQQHRLDASGRLYDMVADPGQSVDIADKRPDVARELRQAVADFRNDVLPGKKDDRPFPVGFVEFPMTPLPARDGIGHGGVRRSAGAPNCSYFTSWKSKDDAITWDIDVHTPGVYRVEIDYTCAAKDVGSTVELRHGEAKSVGKVTEAWDPVLLDQQDRVPRKGESYLKEFRKLTLSPIALGKGRGPLTLRALAIPGQHVMDVRAVTLTLIENK
ncbi:MAG: sulfatase-like hydrolase/transferase [Gemmataceae bacterium]|nr:sulfatase-like hydrolase/transferase [Gemmataceae bacterium]